MRIAWLIGAGLLLAVQTPALAQQSCGDAVAALAQRHNITLQAAGTNGASAPTAPATKESLGVGVMDRLEQPEAVNRPPEGNSGSTAPADPAVQANARRIQAEALLNEARQDAEAGRTGECQTKLDNARPMLEASGN